jgi:hypothetical protein
MTSIKVLAWRMFGGVAEEIHEKSELEYPVSGPKF